MKVELVSNCLGRVSRINLTKIMSQSSAPSSLTRIDSRSVSRAPTVDETLAPSTPLTESGIKVKRNLFGCLNHDLLKSDLNDMWKETKERQKMRWNFDFDQLRPMSNKSTCEPMHQSNPTRYEWSFVESNDSQKVPDFYKTTHVGYKTSRASGQNKRLSPRSANKFSLSASGNSIRNYALHFASAMGQESGRNLHHYQVSNLLFANEAIATAAASVPKSDEVPMGAKLSPSKIRKLSKPMNSDDDDEEEFYGDDEFDDEKGVEVDAASKPATIFTMALRQTTLTKKKVPATPSKPRSKSVGVPSLIITHSENRKDTLRSAGKSATTVQRESRKARTKTESMLGCGEVKTAAFKQQSLLDMLKQRKRRNTDLVSCDKATNVNATNGCGKRAGNCGVNQLQLLPNEIDIQI